MIWDTEADYNACGTISAHNSDVVFCVYSPDGRRAASCSEDKIIRLFDTKKGSFQGQYVKIATFNYHTKPLKAIGFSHDSKYLISGGDDNDLVEWNARNAKIASTYIGHSDGIRGCGFTSDGQYVISGATDCTTRLWNRKTKKVDCSFACLSRLCALDSTMLNNKHFIACGDGSGKLYILSPEGLDERPEKEISEDNIEEEQETLTNELQST